MSVREPLATSAVPASAASPSAAPAPLAPDRPHAVRAGEELDRAALAAWLGRAVPALAGVAADDLAVAQFGDGFSNLTYLVRAGAGAGGAELVLRRPPAGVGRGSAHDVLREHRLLVALHSTYGRVPRPIAACDDPAVLGAPFYLMERVHGVVLRGRPGEPVPDAATMRALGTRFVAELAGLHALDWRAAGLGDLGRPEGYARRQVDGWTRRWLAARTGDVPAIERAAAWLAEQPAPASEPAGTLLHNDFKYDNFVLDPGDLGAIRAVLDWEMATVGEPLLDLGTSLGYWLDPEDPPELRALGLGLTAAPGSPSRAELVAAYANTTGRDVGDGLWLYVYGVFKLAVVAQQLHARWAAGHSRDPRFARLDRAVAALGALAARAIALRRIDRLG